MHHGTCVTHVPRCVSGSLTHGGGEKVPDIPDACTTRNFTYLIRGTCWELISKMLFLKTQSQTGLLLSRSDNYQLAKLTLLLTKMNININVNDWEYKLKLASLNALAAAPPGITKIGFHRADRIVDNFHSITITDQHVKKHGKLVFLTSYTTVHTLRQLRKDNNYTEKIARVSTSQFSRRYFKCFILNESV